MMSKQDMDAESEEEYDRTTATAQLKICGNKGQIQTPIIAEDDGQINENSMESDFEDFGSTVSLASSTSNSFSHLPKDKSSSSKISANRALRLDPHVYRKHRDRNISLRNNVTEKLLKPVIAVSIKKVDKLSQNISNYQINMQDALFQSRMATSNLLKLQKQLEKFADANYLGEIKIEESIGPENSVSKSVEEVCIALEDMEDIAIASPVPL